MAEVYDDCIIAFLDILGFQNSLKNDANAAMLLDLLQKIRETEKTCFSSKIDKCNNTLSIEIGSVITAVTDSVIISVPYNKIEKPFDFVHATTAFVDYIAWLTNLLLEYGFLLRGGITVGKLFHSDGIIFGQAYVDAYELEGIAKFPRIVASKTLVELFDSKKTVGTSYEAFIKDCNGEYYLDHLGINLRDRPNLIPKIETCIQNGISRYQDIPKTLSKWEWYYRYFQNSLPAIYQDHGLMYLDKIGCV